MPLKLQPISICSLGPNFFERTITKELPKFVAAVRYSKVTFTACEFAHLGRYNDPAVAGRRHSGHGERSGSDRLASTTIATIAEIRSSLVNHSPGTHIIISSETYTKFSFF